ncbi:MAG: hypothetical protein DME99_06735, partial [Verrucomicrobia bacterium]
PKPVQDASRRPVLLFPRQSNPLPLHLGGGGILSSVASFYGNGGGKFPDKALSFLRPEAKPTPAVAAGNAARCQGSQTRSERGVEN